MKHTHTHRLFYLLALPILAAPIALRADTEAHKHEMHDHQKMEQMASANKLIAVLTPTEGSETKGTVTFEATEDGKVRIHAYVSGLGPNSTHAIHIHEFGDIRKSNGTSTGGHYNPEGHPHSLPEDMTRHAGDLGNLEADASGTAHKMLTVDNISLMGMKNPIIGRAIIVHAGADDGGQPTGNAGARIAQGVIGIMNAE